MSFWIELCWSALFGSLGGLRGWFLLNEAGFPVAEGSTWKFLCFQSQHRFRCVRRHKSRVLFTKRLIFKLSWEASLLSPSRRLHLRESSNPFIGVDLSEIAPKYFDVECKLKPRKVFAGGRLETWGIIYANPKYLASSCLPRWDKSAKIEMECRKLLKSFWPLDERQFRTDSDYPRPRKPLLKKIIPGEGDCVCFLLLFSFAKHIERLLSLLSDLRLQEARMTAIWISLKAIEGCFDLLLFAINRNIK